MDSITNYPLALTVVVALPLFGLIAKAFGATFKKIAKWYLYIAVFAVVVVMNSIFFPFIGGKDYFFRFVIELALIFFVLWWAFEARAGELKTLILTKAKRPLFIAVTIFVALFLIACLFAYDPSAAFWSNYERGEGGFQMIHYYIFFALLIFLLEAEKDWKNLFKFSLVASGLMILYGIAGNFLVEGFIGPYARGGAPAETVCKLIAGRFQGTLGNPAYVAPYLIFSIFFAAYLWISAKAAGHTSKWISWGYGALIAVFLFFFTIAQTRGAFLGLGVGVIALLVYLIIRGAAAIRKRAVMFLVGLTALGILGLVYIPRYITPCLQAARLFQISFSDDTAQTRFWTWGSAWKGFLERPVLGWGPENFTAVFDKYFDPRHFVPGVPTETWFDRAHSVFFDYLSETGILGFLGYLSIFFLFFYEFIKHPHKNVRGPGAPPATSILERGVVIALPIAYLVQGIAIFDVFPMYLGLFIFLAFAHHYLYKNHEQNV